MSKILGVIPAAGRSTRIGNPKPLLDADGHSFLERTVTALREGGVDRVVVGVRDEKGPIRAAAEATGAHVLVPPRVDDGPIATVRAALAWWEEEHGPGEAPGALVLHPVDHPKVRASTVAEIIEAYRASAPALVLPEHGGETGHPVLFSHVLLEELRAGKLDEGARTVVHRHRDGARLLQVDDAGILADIDTVADYRRHYPESFRKRFQKW